MKNKKSGFTLGEVLLAVAVIGLIAALTIPNLNKNVNEDKYISLMKATMGQLDAAVVKVVEEFGSTENAGNSCKANPKGHEWHSCFGEILTRYLETQKICSSTDTSCFSTEQMLNVYGDAISDRENPAEDCGYTFVLSNGVSVCIRSMQRIDVDVDGPKAGPNMRAVDNFDFTYDNDGVGYFIDNRYDGNRGTDRGFDMDYDSVAWAFVNGNMDYLRCADQLRWYSKKTCD